MDRSLVAHPLPMRILQLCPAMHREGTWFRACFLSRALAERGHEVTLVKVSAEARLRMRRFDEDGVHLVETPRFVGARFGHNNTRLPSDLLARVLLVARERFDVIHAYTHHVNALLPSFAARLLRRRTPLVMDWDDLWTDGGFYGDRPTSGWVAKGNYAFSRWCEVRLKRYADAVTVVSGDLRERAIRAGVPAERVAFIPNGAAIDTFSPMPKDPLRRELGLPLDVPLLVFSAFAQVDMDFMLDALADLRDRGVRHFTVITGPHEARTSRMVRQRDLDRVVRVAGVVPLPVLGKSYAAGDVGLLPYADKPLNRARWPIKLGDYLAAGLPIVTCNVGEMGRVVPEWNVGVATEPTSRAFSAGIEKLLKNPALGEYAKRARARAEQFTWARIAADLEDVYQEAAERRRSRLRHKGDA